jgi:hypothetical protein
MSQKTKQSRRAFLKGAAAASGAAVVVATTGTTVAHATEEVEAVASVKKEKGYQETQHIRDYYDTTRS